MLIKRSLKERNHDKISYFKRRQRQLAYAEYGDPDGFPIFFFHGFPGSRLQAGDFHESALTSHCRLIGVDRPGMGRSGLNKQHTLLSWANDIAELTEKLKINQFSIIAHSGGAPFALACAYILQKQIKQINLVSPLAPTTVPEAIVAMPAGFKVINMLSRNVFGFARVLMLLQQHIILRPKFFKRLLQQLPAADRDILNHKDIATNALSATKEAFYQGSKGVAYEFRLVLKDWGFELESIQTLITLWHEKLDQQAPISFATYMAQKLPNLLEKDAHLSTLYRYIEDMM